MGWASARKAWKDLVAREGCGGEEAEGEPEAVEPEAVEKRLAAAWDRRHRFARVGGYLKEVVGAWEDSLKLNKDRHSVRSVRRKVMKALDDARLEKDGAGREIADMVRGKRRRVFLNALKG